MSSNLCIFSRGLLHIGPVNFLLRQELNCLYIVTFASHLVNHIHTPLSFRQPGFVVQDPTVIQPLAFPVARVVLKRLPTKNAPAVNSRRGIEHRMRTCCRFTSKVIPPAFSRGNFRLACTPNRRPPRLPGTLSAHR